MAKQNLRADHVGEHNTAYLKNRAKLFKAGGVCGICGKPIDMTIKDPTDPKAPVVDHIIPISKGGHPSDISNLQLAHRWCNRQKGDKFFTTLGGSSNTPPSSCGGLGSAIGVGAVNAVEDVGNNNLPLHCDWARFRAER